MRTRLTLRKRKKAVLPPAIVMEAVAKMPRKPVVRKKAVGARLWMKIDRLGHSESMELDKSAIIEHTSIQPRDMRILLSIFTESSSILSREKAMIVNLEFIRAIVTAEEVLLLDPLRQEVLPFVDQLRRHLSQKSPSTLTEAGQIIAQDSEMASPILPVTDPQGSEDELPFEFQVLEIALQVIFAYLDSSVAELERDAYPALDELIKDVNITNLEHVRNLKSNLIHLLRRVQKVRDEIEHFLDDNEAMSQLYLTRKWMLNQRIEALSDAPTSDGIITHAPHPRRLSSFKSGSFVSNYTNVEDLEMLFEACFMQFDATRNKILLVREYIDDTEDYVRIQLDNKRNEILQLQLILGIASFVITFEILVTGIFSVNIPCTLYNKNGIYGEFVGLMTTGAILLFFLIWGYARWKNLLDS